MGTFRTVSFHEFDQVGLVKAGSNAERERARLGASRMVLRAGGDADDLRLALDMLDLWPASESQ
jgi:hypothetical protein